MTLDEESTAAPRLSAWRKKALNRDVPVLTKQVQLENIVALHIKARPYVLDTKYEKAFETDVHLRVLEAFAKYAILPPAVLVRTLDAASSMSAGRAVPELPS